MKYLSGRHIHYSLQYKILQNKQTKHHYHPNIRTMSDDKRNGTDDNKNANKTNNNNNPTVNKGRLKLVTKLLMDNKYELMDDLNYSRAVSLTQMEENISMGGMNGGRSLSPVHPGPQQFQQQEREPKTSLDSRIITSTASKSKESSTERHKRRLSTSFSRNDNETINGFPYLGTSVTQDLPLTEEVPLLIPKSTRLKAERVRIYLDYYFNVLERCILLDQGSLDSPTSGDSIAVSQHHHRHRHHEGVEGVYNPLQVIRNRKLRKKYHAELKPLRELTFTKVPLIAVEQFSSKPNRKLKWFVELSEKYSDLTWRTSHWNELRRPDGKRWIVDPKYNMLLNDGSNVSLVNGTHHRRRNKIKNKLKQIKRSDDAATKKEQKEKKKREKDKNDTLNESHDLPSPLKHYSKEAHSSQSVNVIDPSKANENNKSLNPVPELTSKLSKVEKIISKTTPKRFSRSPRRHYNDSNITNVDVDPGIPKITTTLPSQNSDFHINSNNTPANSSNHLTLPGDNANTLNTRKSSKTAQLSEIGNETKSNSSSFKELKKYLAISSPASTSKSTMLNDTSDYSGYLSSQSSSATPEKAPSSVSSRASFLSSSSSSSSLSTSSLDSNESSQVLNLDVNRNRKNRRDSIAPGAPTASQRVTTNATNNNDDTNKNSGFSSNNVKHIDPSKRGDTNVAPANNDINGNNQHFIEARDTNIDDQLDSSNYLSNDRDEKNVVIDEQLLQYWQDTRYILSTISIMKHRRKTHTIVKKRAIKRRNDTIKVDNDTDYNIIKTREIIEQYDKELDKVIKVGNSWTSRLLNDYLIRVETLISSSDRILSDINTTLTLKLKLFQENTERFDNFKIINSQRSTRLVYKLLEIFIIGILWSIWLLALTVKKIRLGLLIGLKVVKWMVW